MDLNEIATKKDIQELKEVLEKAIKLIDAKRPGRKKKWVKSSTVCELLNIDSETLYRWRDSGKIPFSRIGRTYFYDIEDIENILEERRQNNINYARK